MTCDCAKKLKFSLLVILLVILEIKFSDQQEACTLPDGVTQSTCKRLHHCDGLWNQVKEHGKNVPKHIADHVNSHKCPAGRFFCCPDFASNTRATIPETSETPETTETSGTSETPETPAPPETLITQYSPSDLEAIKSHRNYGMLNERTCGKAGGADRIIGGVNAKLFEFPWNALLGYQSSDSFEWGCGGSLINPKFVLTAAHCIKQDLKKVRLGEHNIESEKDCDDFNACADPVQDIDIEKIIKHPEYRKRTNDPRNDIALLELATQANTTTNNVKTICLPLTPECDISKLSKKLTEKLLISGWGKISNGHLSNILQKAYVPLVENRVCQSRFSQLDIHIYDTYLCAGGHNKTDTCFGDSGGGIMSYAMVNNQAKAVLYGVISSGVACEKSDVIFPGIYINVKYYLEWILDNMS